MGIFTKKPVTQKRVYKPVIAKGKATKPITEAFKGQIKQNKIKFPKELGIEHPFDFEMTENVYKKVLIIMGIVDKYVDFIVGQGFYVKSKKKKASDLITEFLREQNFDVILRAWVKESLIKGNAFLELSYDTNKFIDAMKVLDAKYMYVDRDNEGNLDGYKQYLGKDLKGFTKTEVTDFKPKEVAHLLMNKIGDNAYGYGIIATALVTINNLLQSEKDLHTLMSRKANSPLHVKIGDVAANMMPTKEDIDAVNSDLQTLTNKTEWATDASWDMKVIDFGNVGDKFSFVLENDIDMLIYGLQVPMVLLGKGNIPEGLAKVQMDAFQRNIQSKQSEIEKVIETQIFKPILLAAGLDVHVEFEWGRPSNEERNENIKIITELLKTPMINPGLRTELESRLAMLMELDEKKIEDGDEEREQEETEETPPLLQPNESHNHDIKESVETIDEFYGSTNTIKEWVTVDFDEYTKKIIEAISIDKFELLAGTDIEQLKAGMFTPKQVESLRTELTKTFKSNGNMRQLAKNIELNVNPGDLYKMKEGKVYRDSNGKKVLSISKEFRPMNIARTEVIKEANIGRNEYYKTKGVEQVRWVAAMSERTCDECMSMDGTIMNIDNANLPPLHPMCFIDSQVPIYTSKGWKPIGKIKINDLVLSHKGKFRKVTSLIQPMKYDGEVIKIFVEHEGQKGKFRQNFVTVTPEHPILTINGWKKAIDLTKKDEIMLLAKTCKQCGKKFPHFTFYDTNEFCSLSCANRFSAIEQFNDIKQHEIRSVKAKAQMHREYTNGVRDKFEITKKALLACKKKIKEKGYLVPLCNRLIGDKNPSKRLEVRKKMSEVKLGTKNPMHKSKHSKQYWEKVSERQKKYWKEHPEKHPNTIMSKKGFISKPQKELYKIIKRIDKNTVLEHPVQTKKSVRFIDVAIPDKKIGFEYDGSYWHKDKQKDLLRHKEIENQGWTLLHFNENNFVNVKREAERILMNHNDEYEFMSSKISNIEKWTLKKPRRLYNFSVEGDESYIAKGIVTHNCRCSISPVTKLK